MTQSAMRQSSETPPTVRTYQIQHRDYRAEVVSVGAGLRMFERAGAPLTETWPAGTKPPLSAGLVLAPWPSRIRDGFFYFNSTEHQLEITDAANNAASHGLVRRREWRLEEHSSARVKQSIDLGLHKGWPYPMRLGVTHEVTADGLVVTHTATNTGGVDAPFGLGVHTFVRAGNHPVDECTLQLNAGVYQPLDDRLLPDGPPLQVFGTDYDFTRSKSLEGVQLDTPFSAGLPDDDGRFRHIVRGPDGSGTVLWVDKAFGWVQVFIADPANGKGYPERGRALAIEPMTCPPNAFNSGIDEIVLAPGQTWSAKWGMAAL